MTIPLEARTAACATRSEYDAAMAKMLAVAIPDEAERQEALQTQYPKTVAEAARELRFRGLLAQGDILERWGELVGVRIEQGVQWWTRHNIDTLAEQLLQAGKLTSIAYWNARQGSTWASWFHAEYPEHAEPDHDGV